MLPHADKGESLVALPTVEQCSLPVIDCIVDALLPLFSHAAPSTEDICKDAVERPVIWHPVLALAFEVKCVKRAPVKLEICQEVYRAHRIGEERQSQREQPHDRSDTFLAAAGKGPSLRIEHIVKKTAVRPGQNVMFSVVLACKPLVGLDVIWEAQCLGGFLHIQVDGILHACAMLLNFIKDFTVQRLEILLCAGHPYHIIRGKYGTSLHRFKDGSPPVGWAFRIEEGFHFGKTAQLLAFSIRKRSPSVTPYGISPLKENGRSAKVIPPEGFRKEDIRIGGKGLVHSLHVTDGPAGSVIGSVRLSGTKFKFTKERMGAKEGYPYAAVIFIYVHRRRVEWVEIDGHMNEWSR